METKVVDYGNEIGASIAIVASVIGNLGTNMQKHSHNVDAAQPGVLFFCSVALPSHAFVFVVFLLFSVFVVAFVLLRSRAASTIYLPYVGA